jgi:prolyl-tRNA synthetase
MSQVHDRSGAGGDGHVLFGRVAGAVTRWTATLIPTLRETPAEAEAPSHVLLLRAGFIRKLGAGIYDYLPLGYRVLKKISAIVREEMDAAGAQELHLPVLLPIELYAETRRDRDYGELLFRVHDRRQATYALGPTHEEPITELVRGSVSSYKQLPLCLYQVQTKFRDEARPRSGLLRGREFLMKDAYSFHTTVDGPGGLTETYDRMHAAYSAIFRRCGLSFTVVEAESGPIGGSASHEFMVNCLTGEDTILRCPVSGYAANVEKCEIGPRPAPSRGYFVGAPTGPLEEVHTPGCPGIDDVVKAIGVKPRHMLKCVLFRVKSSLDPLKGRGPTFILAVVRGDHDVNEGKVRTAAGVAAIELADPKEAAQAGFAVGFISPRSATGRKDVLLLVDRDAAIGHDDTTDKPMFWVTGGDRTDYHIKHFNWQRDLGRDPLAALHAASNAHQGGHGQGQGTDPLLVVADVRNALEGDPSPRVPGARLQTGRGIEVGHIFKLGTKYSEAMGLFVTDDRQQKRPVIMGCYGIGVSRTVAAAVEQNHDANGIVWPVAIAPYHVIITLMKPGDESHVALARHIAEQLSARGVDVLIDDRDERPGVKFKDADLIGVPIRITIGDKAMAAGAVEFRLRIADDKGELVKTEDVVNWTIAALRHGRNVAAPATLSPTGSDTGG